MPYMESQASPGKAGLAGIIAAEKWLSPAPHPPCAQPGLAGADPTSTCTGVVLGLLCRVKDRGLWSRLAPGRECGSLQSLSPPVTPQPSHAPSRLFFFCSEFSPMTEASVL